MPIGVQTRLASAISTITRSQGDEAEPTAVASIAPAEIGMREKH